MTRSLASRFVVAVVVATLLFPACRARSIVIGGEPLEGEAGDANAARGGNGAVSSGGAISSGGALAGSAGTVGGAGGAGGAFDPYPRVSWGDGQGYREACPHFGDTWGFTCWNFDGETHSCTLTGNPYCNACSCAVPCGDAALDCPRGAAGDPAECIASSTTSGSCFLVCDDGHCPDGMQCTAYPGAARHVCMWVSDPPFVVPPVE